MATLPGIQPSVPAITTRTGVWRERFFYTLTLCLVMLLWLPQAIRWMEDSDFVPHGEDVKRTLDSLMWVILNIPHFMFQALSAGVARLSGWNVYYSMGLVILLAMLTTSAILYVLFRRAVAGDAPLSWRQGMLVVASVLVTMIVAPFNLLTPETLYFGYLTPNVWHNPTVNLMKPSALLIFFIGLRVYDPAWRPRPRVAWTAAIALLTIFCLFSKPNFLIAFLPALALVSALFLLLRRHIHWLILLGGIVLPAGLMLLVQTQTWSTSAGIELSPLETFALWAYHYDPLANHDLVFKFLASVAFPLTVYGLYWRSAARSLMLNLAWLTFGFGALYLYLMVDRSNPVAGDFTWSAQFGVYLLFVTHLLFLTGYYRKNPLEMRLVLPIAILGLHILAGVHWYTLHLSQPYLELVYRWW